MAALRSYVSGWLPVCAAVSLVLGGCASQRDSASSQAEPPGFWPKIASLTKREPRPDYASFTQIEEDKPLTSESQSRLQAAYGQIQEKYGNHKDARAAYEKSLKANKRSVEAICGMARLDALAGKNKEAERRFEDALKLAPKNTVALTSYGEYWAQQKDWDKALPLFRRAADADPDSREVRHTLAVHLAKAGQADAAVAEFKRIVGEAPAHYNVGVILAEQGDTAEAERKFTAALEIDPQMEDATAWLADLRAAPGSQLPEHELASHAASRAPSPGGSPVSQARGRGTNRPGAAPAITPASVGRGRAVSACRDEDCDELDATPPSRPPGISDLQWEQLQNQR